MRNLQNRTVHLILFFFIACTLGLGTATVSAQTASSKQATTHKTASKSAARKKPTHHVRHTKHHRTHTVTRHKTSAHSRVIHRKRLHTAQASVHASHYQVASYSVRHESKLAQRIDSSSEINSLTRHTALRSEAVFVQDLGSSAVLYSKNSDQVHPIASISKLMTAIIVLDAHQPMDQILEITEADVDRLRYSRSRLRVGTRLSRYELLHLALMSSENRAAHALARNYPGGMPAFVRAMNDKARSLGMRHTHFIEPTGLSSSNVSTPRDLVKLLVAASKKPLIHRFTTDTTQQVTIAKGRTLVYNNSNGLVRNPAWHIEISKTGFINEAGECLVMLAHIDKRPIAIVLLDSTGRYSRIGDAMRVRHLVEKEFNVAML